MALAFRVLPKWKGRAGVGCAQLANRRENEAQDGGA